MRRAARAGGRGALVTLAALAGGCAAVAGPVPSGEASRGDDGTRQDAVPEARAWAEVHGRADVARLNNTASVVVLELDGRTLPTRGRVGRDGGLEARTHVVEPGARTVVATTARRGDPFAADDSGRRATFRHRFRAGHEYSFFSREVPFGADPEVVVALVDLTADEVIDEVRFGRDTDPANPRPTPPPPPAAPSPTRRSL